MNKIIWKERERENRGKLTTPVICAENRGKFVKFFERGSFCPAAEIVDILICYITGQSPCPRGETI